VVTAGRALALDQQALATQTAVSRELVDDDAVAGLCGDPASPQGLARLSVLGFQPGPRGVDRLQGVGDFYDKTVAAPRVRKCHLLHVRPGRALVGVGDDPPVPGRHRQPAKGLAAERCRIGPLAVEGPVLVAEVADHDRRLRLRGAMPHTRRRRQRQQQAPQRTRRARAHQNYSASSEHGCEARRGCAPPGPVFTVTLVQRGASLLTRFVDASEMPFGVKKTPAEQLPAGTLKLFNVDLHLAVIADVKHTLKALYGDKVHVTHWSICGKDGASFGFERPTKTIDDVVEMQERNGGTGRYQLNT